MLNHVVLMGRLTRDPELRRTGSGHAVTSFTIACDHDFAPQGGEKETDFIDIVTWRSTAEFAQKYFAKGSMIVVSGRLQLRAPERRSRCRQCLFWRKQEADRTAKCQRTGSCL